MRSFLGGGCVHMYCTLTVTVLYSLKSISDTSQISNATISKWPFHELEFLVGGWVCKPILVIGFARAQPQADQYKYLLSVKYLLFSFKYLTLSCKSLIFSLQYIKLSVKYLILRVKCSILSGKFPFQFKSDGSITQWS